MTAMNNHDSKNLEEEKRMEYEQWLKQQQKEQQMMQYDCSVKYEESQSAVSSTATTQGNSFSFNLCICTTQNN